MGRGQNNLLYGHFNSSHSDKQTNYTPADYKLVTNQDWTYNLKRFHSAVYCNNQPDMFTAYDFYNKHLIADPKHRALAKQELGKFFFNKIGQQERWWLGTQDWHLSVSGSNLQDSVFKSEIYRAFKSETLLSGQKWNVTSTEKFSNEQIKNYSNLVEERELASISFNANNPEKLSVIVEEGRRDYEITCIDPRWIRVIEETVNEDKPLWYFPLGSSTLLYYSHLNKIVYGAVNIFPHLRRDLY
jgi:hypothetical protein